VKELRDWVGEELGPIAKPDDIRFADNLPKTRSGKIMRRLLKAIARGEEITQDVSHAREPGDSRAAARHGGRPVRTRQRPQDTPAAGAARTRAAPKPRKTGGSAPQGTYRHRPQERTAQEVAHPGAQVSRAPLPAAGPGPPPCGKSTAARRAGAGAETPKNNQSVRREIHQWIPVPADPPEGQHDDEHRRVGRICRLKSTAE